jgi:hypothetical protein
MSELVIGAGIPFFGPAVAIWITLIVGVMAFYFLSVCRPHRSRGVPESRDRLPLKKTETWTPSQLRPTHPPSGVTSDPAPVRPQFPVYEMENFSDGKWVSPVDSSSFPSQV